jgi:hypothetical protein
MNSPDNNIIELKPNPGKWIGFLTFSLFSALMGGIRARNGGWLVGGMLVAWGSLGCVICTVVLFSKKMVLRLTSEGFAFGTLRKKYFYKWSDIAEFGVGRAGTKRTCFNLRWHRFEEERVRRINRGSIGFDRFLPDTYGKKPMELARLLEDWRYRYSILKTTELQ